MEQFSILNTNGFKSSGREESLWHLKTSLSINRLKTRFELNMRDIEFTAENQIQTLKDQIFECYNVEDLTTRLRNLGDSLSPEELKIQKRILWNQIKLFAFTRMVLGLYMITLHAEFTTILISIFGRFDYLDSLEPTMPILMGDGLPELEETSLLPEPSISDETRRRFLTISWFILHKGWKEISLIVYEAVLKSMREYYILISIPLNFTLDFDSLKDLLQTIRQEIDQANLR